MEWKINPGTILALIGMMTAGLGGFFELRTENKVLSVRIDNIEKDTNRRLTRIEETLTNLDAKLDRYLIRSE